MERDSLYSQCFDLHNIKDRIKFALKHGVELTQADASRWPFFTSRLGAFIHRLRKEGCPIETKRITVKCGDGHLAVVAQYFWKG